MQGLFGLFTNKPKTEPTPSNQEFDQMCACYITKDTPKSQDGAYKAVTTTTVDPITGLNVTSTNYVLKNPVQKTYVDWTGSVVTENVKQ